MVLPADKRSMKILTVAAARRCFGALIKAVQHESVLVVRTNGDKAMLVSARHTRGFVASPRLSPHRPNGFERREVYRSHPEGKSGCDYRLGRGLAGDASVARDCDRVAENLSDCIGGKLLGTMLLRDKEEYPAAVF